MIQRNGLVISSVVDANSSTTLRCISGGARSRLPTVMINDRWCRSGLGSDGIALRCLADDAARFSKLERIRRWRGCFGRERVPCLADTFLLYRRRQCDAP